MTDEISAGKDIFYDSNYDSRVICLSPEDIINDAYLPAGTLESLGFTNTIPFNNRFLDRPSFMRGPPR